MRPAHPIRGQKESIFNTEKQGEGTEAAEKEEFWRCAQWVGLNIRKGWVAAGLLATPGANKPDILLRTGLAESGRSVLAAPLFISGRRLSS
jgi:hypothetical protein